MSTRLSNSVDRLLKDADVELIPNKTKAWQRFVNNLAANKSADLRLLDDLQFDASDADRLCATIIDDSQSPLGKAYPPVLSKQVLGDKLATQELGLQAEAVRAEYESLVDAFPQNIDHEGIVQVEEDEHGYVQHTMFPFDLEYSMTTKRDMAWRQQVMGVNDVDATIVTSDQEWFCNTPEYNKQWVKELQSPQSHSFNVTCRGTHADSSRQILEMWQMIFHTSAGLVVSVLESQDQEKASWSGLEQLEFEHHNHGVTLKVEYDFLPTNVEKLLSSVNGNKDKAGKQLNVVAKSLVYKLDNQRPRRLIHLLVNNWTDMTSALLPNELLFLYRLVQLIRGIQQSSNKGTFKNVYTNRSIFHCSAGCGRSNLVLAASLMANTETTGLNSNIYDVVHHMKQQRRHAINCWEHYASLYLFCIRFVERPRLHASIILGHSLGNLPKNRAMKMMSVIIALRDVSCICWNSAWYQHLFPPL